MKNGILLTGGTGFLGTELAAQLIQHTEKTVYVLVRARDEAHAAARLKAAWKEWYHPMENLVSIMIKQADVSEGSCMGNPVRKELTEQDKAILARATEQSKQILLAMGAKEEEIFLGTLNAGHPGGMFPLTEAEKDTLHSRLLPENFYIADATLIPKAMGNPPMLTIMALAKRIAGKIKKL